MAISVAPLTATVMGAVEQRHAGIASGINNAVSRGAGLLAIAAMGLMMLGLFGRGLDRRLEEAGLRPEARREIEAQQEKLAALEVPASLGEPARSRAEAAVDEAFLDAYRGVMLAAAGLALLASISAGWLIRGAGSEESVAGGAGG